MVVKLSYTDQKYSFKQFEAILFKRVRKVLRENSVTEQELRVINGPPELMKLTLAVLTKVRPRAKVRVVKVPTTKAIRGTCADYEIIDALEALLKSKTPRVKRGIPLLGEVTREECNVLTKQYALERVPERKHPLLDELKQKDPNVLFSMVKSVKYLENLRLRK